MSPAASVLDGRDEFGGGRKPILLRQRRQLFVEALRDSSFERSEFLARELQLFKFGGDHRSRSEVESMWISQIGFDMQSPNAQTTPAKRPDSLRSEEAERNLLACCILDAPDVLAQCQEANVGPESFVAQPNRIIYEQLIKLNERRQAIDVAVLAEELKTAGLFDAIGGLAYITLVTSRIPTTAQSAFFIARVRELHLLRDLAKTATTVAEDCYNYTGGIDQFVDRVEQRLMAVTQKRSSGRSRPIREPTHEALSVISRTIESKGELTGVSSGLTALDRLTHGFQRQDMIVLAARPSMGKTALALGFAETAALPAKGPPRNVLIFSLEMGCAQLATRLICSRARVNLTKLRNGLISKNSAEQTRIIEVAEEIASAPIFIDDSSAISIMELRAKARRVHMQTPLGLVICDYLQLLNPVDPLTPREEQVAEASRGLKALARELDVPVVVLSQLNRSPEKGNRQPKLSDLRESGSIEQDADVVLLLGRPLDSADNFQVGADTADLIVAKQRNGPVDTLKLAFLRDLTRFENASTD